MKIKNWIACVQDRGKWKEVVEKAKTFNQEIQRQEEEEEEEEMYNGRRIPSVSTVCNAARIIILTDDSWPE